VTEHLSRRDFLLAGAAAIPLAGKVAPASRFPSPAVILQQGSRPCVIATANGIRGVARAMELITQGVDTLDAAVEAVKIQELDPADQTVGYGGLPNAEGVVQLDASCMHGPTKRAGAVGCLEGIKTPSEVAKLVLRYTNHILMVGEGAQRFAVQFGLQVESLLTDASRQAWLRWRANLNPDDNWLDVDQGETFSHPPTGTINCDIVNARGEISSVTTTSGLAWKIPGRVGDSAIVGAGQYTDNDVGAAGSTGRGESNIKVCGSFVTVENLRRGMAPTDACLATLRRAVATTEPGLLDARGRPKFQLTYYALNKRGQYGCASLYSGYRAGTYAVHDGSEARLVEFAFLYEGEPPT
jgi:N4-(beta-N-acetylglucosaminyl)-L-asparaginase